MVGILLWDGVARCSWVYQNEEIVRNIREAESESIFFFFYGTPPNDGREQILVDREKYLKR